jgi:hypothetical protein
MRKAIPRLSEEQRYVLLFNVDLGIAVFSSALIVKLLKVVRDLLLAAARFVARVTSPIVTAKDHIFTTEKPVTYQVACEIAREKAKLRRSELIVLLPAD